MPCNCNRATRPGTFYEIVAGDSRKWAVNKTQVASDECISLLVAAFTKAGTSKMCDVAKGSLDKLGRSCKLIELSRTVPFHRTT